jgi:hypothetical protein
MPPVEFEPTISAGERPQTYTLDRAATATGNNQSKHNNIILKDKKTRKRSETNGRLW